MDRRGTQLAALRWVQLVGVRSSSILGGLKRVHRRAAEGASADAIFGKTEVV